MQVIEEFVIYMVTCRGKPSPTTPFYGLTVGTSIKNIILLHFPFVLYTLFAGRKFPNSFFVKRGEGVVGEGLPTGKNQVFDHARDRRLY